MRRFTPFADPSDDRRPRLRAGHRQNTHIGATRVNVPDCEASSAPKMVAVCNQEIDVECSKEAL
jgi:hypothetical protein